MRQRKLTAVKAAAEKSEKWRMPATNMNIYIHIRDSAGRETDVP